MACFPHPPAGTPRRQFVVAASSSATEDQEPSGRDPDFRGFDRSADACVKVSRVLAAGGRDKRAMDGARPRQDMDVRSEEHTSELQSLMRISYAVFCLQKKNKTHTYM